MVKPVHKKKRRNVYPYRAYAKKTSGEDLGPEDYLHLFGALKHNLSLKPDPNDPSSAFIKDHGEYSVILIESVDDESVYGQIAYAREDAWPRVLRNDGNIVSLKEEGYIYEPTHFAFFTHERLFLVEYNHYGPRIGALQRSIQAKGSDLRDNMPFELEYFAAKQLLRKDQFEELLRMGDIASFEFEISTSAIMIPDGDLEGLLSHALDNAREHGVATLKMAVSREKRAKKGGIRYDKRSIIDFVHKWGPYLNMARAKAEPDARGMGRIEMVDLLGGKYAEIAWPILQGRSIDSTTMYDELSRIRDKVVANLDILSDST